MTRLIALAIVLITPLGSFRSSWYRLLAMFRSLSSLALVALAAPAPRCRGTIRCSGP